MSDSCAVHVLSFVKHCPISFLQMKATGVWTVYHWSLITALFPRSSVILVADLRRIFHDDERRRETERAKAKVVKASEQQ